MSETETRALLDELAKQLLCVRYDSPCHQLWGTDKWGDCKDPGGEWELCHGCAAYAKYREVTDG